MALLIDTSVCIDIERATRSASLLERTNQPIFLAAITASELLHGVERADSVDRRARRAAFVERILDVVPILPFDLDVARVHAQIWATLVDRGEVIGSHDLMIAATAVCHDLSLLTNNGRDFRRGDGLSLESA
ncbi:MAG TPA: PIN domain-containing protein [Thermoanaerobaculia bacterium]|nr:PIN domain-containing protein [Thermoanaerobaculia bacterium]